MMTSLCHGTLASASALALALQGVALALALALALESVALLTSLVHYTMIHKDNYIARDHGYGASASR